MEAWIIKLSSMKRNEAIEMCMFCWMIRIRWTARTSNGTLMEMMTREHDFLTVVTIVKKKKTAYL